MASPIQHHSKRMNTAHTTAGAPHLPFPLTNIPVMICGAAKPGLRDLCLTLQSLGAQVVFYPVVLHETTEDIVADCRAKNITIAEHEELLKTALQSAILIEDDARISRWLHSHGLRQFGKLQLIIERTDEGMAYWGSRRELPCAVVQLGK